MFRFRPSPQPLGGLVYLAVVVAPGLLGGSRARRLGRGAVRALDPGRDDRAAGAD